MSKRKSMRGRQYAREQADLAVSLKAAPELNSFTFDGPWPVSSAYDLLDNMYCADNGLSLIH
ncbi:phage portal protein, partial [Klebsiella pneumoniae]|nr:phage portal protein [Klebsiella pneumoniae]